MTDTLDPLRDALAFARVTVRGDGVAIAAILDNADPSLMAAALLALYTDEWRRGLPSYEATNDDLDAHLARMQARLVDLAARD